jgi:Kef-type K+ transport system membrane component KefB/nucleotide-binding universal stress UspA family protein
MIAPISAHQIFLFLVQFALLLASARLLGEVMKRYGQPPVFGELLAGIVLGPSLFGWLAPDLFVALFPREALQYQLLELMSWLGMIFLLLFTGLETDLTILRKLGRPAALASILGILVPFTLGYILGTFIPDRLVARPEQRIVFHLFMGTAMAISAVPVIAKILMDLNILRRNIGAIIMGAVIVDDIIGWTILSMLIGMTTKGVLDLQAVALSVSQTIAFVTVALLVGIQLVRRLMRWIDERVLIEEGHITAVIVITLICAAITEAIGIHAVFGAFVAGVILAQSPRVRANALEKLVGVVHGVFTPVFFAFVGLRVNLTLLDDIILVGAVIAVACAGKLLGCTLGGLLGRLSWWESLSIGIGMNARGGMELIVALIGLTSGILGPELYSSLVIMAIVTSLMTPPLLKWSLQHIPLSSEEQERLGLTTVQRGIFDKRTLRVLIPAAGGPNAQTAMRMAVPLATNADARITTLFVGKDPAQNGGFLRRWWREKDQPAEEDPLFVLQRIAQDFGVTIEKRVISADGTREGELVRREAQRGYDLLLLGASGYQHPLGGEFLGEILKDPPTHVAIVKARDEKPRYQHILVPTADDVYSQLAVEFATMYAEDVGAQVTLLHVLPSPEQQRFRWFRRRHNGLDENVLKMMADTMLWEMRPTGTKPDLRLTAKVIEGERPTEVILREARQGSYDLVVLGVESRTGRAGTMLSQGTEQIVNQVPCTVVVVFPRGLRTSFIH